MAGYYRYTAVLDACVLYPFGLRDVLVTLASVGVYGARWTNQIHEEWTRNLLISRPDLSATTLAKTVQLMNDAVEDSCIENYEYLIDSLNLPDPNDRHVLAAAIVGHADAIVTFNLKDFPDEVARMHNIDVLHPDNFIIAQYDLEPTKTLSAFETCRKRLKNPPFTVEEQVTSFESHQMPHTAALLRSQIRHNLG